MSSVNQNDLKELLSFVLQTEKQAYKENPMPTRKEQMIKNRDYKKKVEEITHEVAKREGLRHEN